MNSNPAAQSDRPLPAIWPHVNVFLALVFIWTSAEALSGTDSTLLPPATCTRVHVEDHLSASAVATCATFARECAVLEAPELYMEVHTWHRGAHHLCSAVLMCMCDTIYES